MEQLRDEMEEMRVELAALTRKELQSLAKQEGIRANGRSADIIETLLQAAFPEFFPEIDERSIDDSDKQLEALVERCLRIANPGCGKTELVHALARDMGANLLYIPAGDLLKSCQEQGQRLLRAVMRVARRVSPCVVCFDDAHRSFPAGSRSPSQQRMLVELTVQLQQLADMQQQLQERQQQRGSGGGSAADAPGLISPASKGPRPAWGAVQGGKQQQKPEEQVQRQNSAKQQQPSYASLGGPVVVVFASRHPEALDPSLLGLLQLRLLLDLPAGESREELLLSWLMEKEAAVGVNDVEQLARDTEGFSCSDLLQLCTEAAMRPLQEQRARRAICMRDFEAAFLKVTPSVPPQRRAQLLAWTGAQQ
ncbi:hypothetical protein OEZ85_012632 [Tetradesmus obliquus]|uniref:SAP domain-containing protein n=1 Tax=Tetradesmus obliquus TaxID=3088 RepID=A0ABY8U344_TETOB|nr:hypothetical protein OEZ85_012632 [Tetradesmus obliquus]